MHSLLARAVENKNITRLLIEVKTTVPVKSKGLDTRMLVLIFTEGIMITTHNYSPIYNFLTPFITFICSVGEIGLRAVNMTDQT